MAVSSDESLRGSNADQYPLLMERHDNHGNLEHVIDVDRGGEASSSDTSGLGFPRGVSHDHSRRETNGAQSPPSRSSASSRSSTTSSSPSFGRGGEAIGRRNWSPFNSGFWILIELAFTLSQIIASIIVLCLSRNEHPQTPLFAWAFGYTAGCFASLPVLYWRFIHRNPGTEGVVQPNQASPHANSASGENSYATIHEDHQSVPSSAYEGLTMRTANTRIGLIMDYYKMALDCFFAAWFVVGNVWIFGGHASVSEAPNLYRLCIVYLTLSCIGYAMPFILCAMICCCLPFIVSVLGIRDDQNQVKGASEESINTLPTYKFKVKKDNGIAGQPNPEEGGFVAIGTEKERIISGEDAVCCICLTRYMDNDQLRELPCSHFFHSECVDKWLKISATCPLCKYEIVEEEEEETSSPTPTDPAQQI